MGLTLVTLSVVESSLSPNLELPGMRSPALARSPRRAGGTYDPFFPGPAAPVEAGAGSSPMPAATSAVVLSPIGAMVSLYGHRAVKCSPEQIRHLTFLSLSCAFIDCAFGSFFSSLASLRQFTDGTKMIFSPTLVVSDTGPGESLADKPNFFHFLRSATRGFTTSRRTVFLMRLVVFTF